MLYFNSCPRCQNGTIEYTSDMWGKYLSCLMCGYAIHSKSIRPDASDSGSSEPTMGTPSLAGATVSADADADSDDDEDLFDDLDESDEDESAARVAFG